MSHTIAVSLAAGDLSNAVGPISATALALLTRGNWRPAPRSLWA